MRSFRSPNLGVRRLSIVLAVVGALAGAWVAEKPFRALQNRRWDNAYFRAEVPKHPELTLAQNEDGWYLMDKSPHPEWEWFRKYNQEDWHWRVVERFSRTADEPPKLREYLPLALPVLGGAVLAWLLVHTVAWVAAGFKIGAARPA